MARYCNQILFISVVISTLFFLDIVKSFDISNARIEWRENTPFKEWKKQGLSNEQMIDLLVNNMTLKQKVRQLDQYKGMTFLSNGNLDNSKSTEYLKETIGQIHDLYPPDSSIINDLQESVLKLYMQGESPPIPIIFAEECLHGLGQGGHTVFPQSIALASSWDSDLLFRVGKAIGSEARAYNIRECFSPVLGIAREPRWGRTEETYGEDYHLVGILGKHMVKGLQLGNKSPGNYVSGVGSLIKHFITYSVPVGGRNTAPARIGQREFLSEFAPSFRFSLSNETCLNQTNLTDSYCLTQAIGTMGAYSERDGIPNCADEFLLTELLRDTWGFDGYVLSDLGAIDMMFSTHHTARTPKDAIAQFLEAGGNMQFYDFKHIFYQHSIIKMIENGKLLESLINKRVKEILHIKAKLGLFDDPFVSPMDVSKYVNSIEHQNLALEAGKKSIILLKNNNQILPLAKTKKWKIGLIGPNSDVSMVGDYSGNNDCNSKTTCNYITIKEGLESKYSNSIETLKHVWGTGIQTDKDFLLVRPKYLYPTMESIFNEQNSSCLGHGLYAEYFNNLNLTGEPSLRRIDTQINFNWYHYSPDAPYNVIHADEFSVRWTGYLIPDIPHDIHSINGSIALDSGGDFVRLYLNNQLLINYWNDLNPNPIFSCNYEFKSNETYEIKIEYQKINQTTIQLYWSLFGDHGIQNAIQIAKSSDIAIVCVGENEQTSGENHDQVTLDLNGKQEQLIQSIYETGIPTIVILLQGRPLTINKTASTVDGILSCFFNGQAQGEAIANVLFGDFNPAGRLPITVPLNTGQLPFYYNYKPSAAVQTYVDFPSIPLYHFGFGLSYTSFSYSSLSISPQIISPFGSTTISFVVQNNGTRMGDEVVQLYVRDKVSSVTTPVMQLQAFSRIHDLQPSESRLIQFNINAQDALWLIDRKYQKIVEPGNFTISIGASSNDIRLKSYLLVED